MPLTSVDGSQARTVRRRAGGGGWLGGSRHAGGRDADAG
jgi:hypothetical protein